MQAYFAVVATVAACVSCSVVDEGESHRKYADEFCQNWSQFHEFCSGEGQLPREVVEYYRTLCVEDEWWDWTDECGDLQWERFQCLEQMPCEDLPRYQRNEIEFCEEETDTFFRRCSYLDDHGG